MDSDTNSWLTVNITTSCETEKERTFVKLLLVRLYVTFPKLFVILPRLCSRGNTFFPSVSWLTLSRPVSDYCDLFGENEIWLWIVKRKLNFNWIEERIPIPAMCFIGKRMEFEIPVTVSEFKPSPESGIVDRRRRGDCVKAPVSIAVLFFLCVMLVLFLSSHFIPCTLEHRNTMVSRLLSASILIMWLLCTLLWAQTLMLWAWGLFMLISFCCIFCCYFQHCKWFLHPCLLQELC